MHSTKEIEAAFSMSTMVFIILIMVFCGLALSSVVTDLAVRPLERMLGTVRKIASTVFKFSAEVQQEQNEEEVTDIDSSNEMKLLEKARRRRVIACDIALVVKVIGTRVKWISNSKKSGKSKS